MATANQTKVVYVGGAAALLLLFFALSTKKKPGGEAEGPALRDPGDFQPVDLDPGFPETVPIDEPELPFECPPCAPCEPQVVVQEIPIEVPVQVSVCDPRYVSCLPVNVKSPEIASLACSPSRARCEALQDLYDRATRAGDIGGAVYVKCVASRSGCKLREVVPQ